MPRTPIPPHLIHHPEEIQRNAERFDHLCRLAEEVVLPVVTEALIRETSTTGAEVLTEETALALQELADEAIDPEDIDAKPVIEALQKSLSEELPKPDEKEIHQYARDLSQVLMSTWLESLRGALAKTEILVLSRYLLPESAPGGITWLAQAFGGVRPKISESLLDSAAPFAISEAEVGTIMSTLRRKLFAEPRVVDLPFALAMIGAPGMVLGTTRKFYDHVRERMELHLQDLSKKKRDALEQHTCEPVVLETEPELTISITSKGQQSLESLSKTLPLLQYGCFTKIASLQPMNVDARVRKALTID